MKLILACLGPVGRPLGPWFFDLTGFRAKISSKYRTSISAHVFDVSRFVFTYNSTINSNLQFCGGSVKIFLKYIVGVTFSVFSATEFKFANYFTLNFNKRSGGEGLVDWEDLKIQYGYHLLCFQGR